MTTTRGHPHQPPEAIGPCCRAARGYPWAPPGGHDDPAREGQSSGPARGNRDHPATSGNEPLTGLTMNEIRRMHAILSRPAHPASYHLHWSRWRRRHQARARWHHHSTRLQAAAPT